MIFWKSWAKINSDFANHNHFESQSQDYNNIFKCVKEKRKAKPIPF